MLFRDMAALYCENLTESLDKIQIFLVLSQVMLTITTGLLMVSYIDSDKESQLFGVYLTENIESIWQWYWIIEIN
jgi:hypothetical protein